MAFYIPMALVFFVLFGFSLLLIRALQRSVGAGPAQPSSGRCVRHEQRTSPLPPARVHDAVQRGLLAAGARIVWIEPWRVCAVRGACLKSWGDVMTVWLYPYGVGTVLLIESKPLLVTTLFDGGQGSANVRNVLLSLMADRVVEPRPTW